MRKEYLTVLILLLPIFVNGGIGDENCRQETEIDHRSKTLGLKLIAILSILVAGVLGVCLPILAKTIESLKPEKDLFFLIKAFAAGVILATGFIHVLPDATENLTSPCLNEKTWGSFPFSEFFCMISAIGTLMVDTFATGYYKRQNRRKIQSNTTMSANDGFTDVENGNGVIDVHTHTSHGHTHGSSIDGSENIVRYRLISQVLELGIIVHSVIIGLSLGISMSPSTIKPLIAALSFHQLFEGIGLGGCIVQARFKAASAMIMATFFSLTTPVGVALGIGLSSIYNENSPAALITQGILNSSSSGILIYMAFVDLLAVDFMNPRIQMNGKLLVLASMALLLGAGLMSIMAIWA